MEGRYVLPVEPASGDGEIVVVEVQQEGSHPLDVRLVGCEGFNPYVANIRHCDIGKLKSKFKGTDKEWEAVLSHFLLQKQPEVEHAGILENVRMVYALKGDDIEISIRRDIKGIKVTLGEILLPKDDEFVFNPFEWAQASAQAHSRTLQELADIKARVSSEQNTISKLNAQLDEFIETKNETEAAMLQQFMELLNEKKRKIRDQNRLLASAKVDKDAASAVKSAREETKPRKAGASRTSKRKAPAKAPEPEPEPESEPDADQMEIDQAKAEEQDEESGVEAATPDRSDEETEDDEGPTPASSAPQTRGRSSEPARSQATGAQSSKDAAIEKPGSPPPRRELPFSRPATCSKPAAKKPPPPPDDDETEDEEL